MSINETIAEILRLDAEATPGPWDAAGIYMGLRHLGKHCSDWYYRDSDGNLIEVPRERDAALVAYYRTAAPALAREVRRLQAEVERLRPRPSFCLQCLYDLAGSDCCPECGAEVQDSSDGYQDAYRAGQEAMRERCAALVDRAADAACECDGTLCGPGDVATHDADCPAFDLDDLADAIRALEVSHD